MASKVDAATIRAIAKHDSGEISTFGFDDEAGQVLNEIYSAFMNTLELYDVDDLHEMVEAIKSEIAERKKKGQSN